MSGIEPLTKEELLEWIAYYEEGNDLPDDILVRVLHMAQLHCEKEEG